jgi:hypothetical protein
MQVVDLIGGEHGATSVTAVEIESLNGNGIQITNENDLR